MGYASAMSMALFAVLILITLLQMRVAARRQPIWSEAHAMTAIAFRTPRSAACPPAACSPGRCWLALHRLLSLLPLWMTLKTALVPTATLFDQATLLLPVESRLDNFRRVLGLCAEQTSPLASAPINFALRAAQLPDLHAADRRRRRSSSRRWRPMPSPGCASRVDGDLHAVHRRRR